MVVDENMIMRIYFGNKRANIWRNLFFKHNKNYWNTTEPCFGRIFQMIAIEVGAINPAMLQNIYNEHYVTDESVTKQILERRKLKVLKQAKSLGEEMLKETDIVGNKEDISELLRNHFFIKEKYVERFVKDILCPLLNLVNNGLYYDWTRIEGRTGFWRAVKKSELGDLDLRKKIFTTPNDEMYVKL